MSAPRIDPPRIDPSDRLSCAEVFRKLDDYLDRTLDAEELILVEAHLETCAECAGEYRFEENLLIEVRNKLQRLDAPDELMSRISARLRGAADRTGS